MASTRAVKHCTYERQSQVSAICKACGHERGNLALEATRRPVDTRPGDQPGRAPGRDTCLAIYDDMEGYVLPEQNVRPVLSPEEPQR